MNPSSVDINGTIIDVIIPALNEEAAIASVLEEIPGHLVREVIVCDNGSTDNTARNARAGGATVITKTKKGYGNACMAGIHYIAGKADRPEPHIVVFLDGDHSDYPQDMPLLLAPLFSGQADLVIGSRTLGQHERGSLTFVQKFGNALATKLIRMFYGLRFTDLGPFRAISWDKLTGLGMCDPDYGWTVEMQVKAAKRHLKCVEVPVRYRKRIGKSKVSGTLRGSFLAGRKILTTIFRYKFSGRIK